MRALPRMTTRIKLWPFFALLFVVAFPCSAQLKIIPTPRAEIFAGNPAVIEVRIHNPGAGGVFQILTQLVQSSASLAAPVSKRGSWKTVSISSNQTVLEEIQVVSPPVRAATPFSIIYSVENRNFGQTGFVAHPTNLLSALARETEQTPIALIGVANVLNAALETVGVQKMSAASPEGVPDKVRAIIVVDQTVEEQRLAELLKLADKRATGLIWFRPLREAALISVPTGRGRVIMAPLEWLSSIGSLPRSQLNLVRALQLAHASSSDELNQILNSR